MDFFRGEEEKKPAYQGVHSMKLGGTDKNLVDEGKFLILPQIVSMKNLLVIISFLLISFTTTAQNSSGDALLNTRLNEYMKLSKDMDIDKLLEFMHPNIYKVVPKSVLAETMKGFYSNENIGISIDSIAVSNIGPVFVSDKSNYRDVHYYMVMSMWLKNAEMAGNEEAKESLFASLKAAFQDKSVVLEDKNNKFLISGESLLIAIQDPGEQWLFIGYDKSQAALISQVFSKEVIEHYKL
jgi:hypothetical protein